MNELENILKTATETVKLALIEFDKDLVDTFSPRLDYVNIKIFPEKFRDIKGSLEEVSSLIFDNEESETKIYALNKPLICTADQLLPKISFSITKTKETKPDYVSFVVNSLAPLHTYLGKYKFNPGNIGTLEEGNKQFFVEINSNKVAFSKFGFAHNQELSVLRSKLSEELNLKLRLLADFQNYKKRSEQTLRESGDMANKSVLNHIIEVIDDINRAEKDSDGEALQIITEKLKSILGEQGLEEIPTKSGDGFDPNVMEALSALPASEGQKPNTVIHVDQIGYKYTNSSKIYKPARVIVAK